MARASKSEQLVSQVQQKQAAADMQRQRLEDLNASRMPDIPSANDNESEKELSPTQSTENQGEESVAPADEIRQRQAEARKQARSDETRTGINDALGPANAIKGLFNRKQVKKLNDEIKKNRNKIEENLKTIKKLKKTIRIRLYKIIAELMGGISALAALWDFIKSVLGKEKIQIQQIQKNNEALEKENKKKEREIYNLQNIVQLQIAQQNEAELNEESEDEE